MIFKKSTIALCSSCNLPSFLSSSPPCGITSPCSSSPRWPYLSGRIVYAPNFSSEPVSHVPRRPNRYYATTSNEPKREATSPDDHVWPSSPHPTPYEIFGQHRTAPYRKAKYYELVKIYHPDRHRHASNHRLPHKVRLERYRLVVSAHHILSDPARRRAYDLYGAGWAGNRSMENLYRTADKSWRERPGNASMNATWEDWERWYRERDGETKEEQQPAYMSNQLFAGVLCVFVVMGSLGQAQRASSNTTNLVETKEQHHAEISRDMKRRQTEQVNLNRHERVERFLRQREAWHLSVPAKSGRAASSAGKQDP
ncbi:hypothetical protein GGS23DRAFT_264597 [Durotheca rogersii]|uniref:uncharacterized protein n=1 Tax=Durotheca rogersii TaxID=419775 RepID=UPI00221EEAA4|nr:uncharacterized protein GGS23DRAFT_264597 [Durotheca rogersii]KAI5859859.1 hypothetical protein GGS23DRAFT_264597 [Durotheca rogersii]